MRLKSLLSCHSNWLKHSSSKLQARNRGGVRSVSSALEIKWRRRSKQIQPDSSRSKRTPRRLQKCGSFKRHLDFVSTSFSSEEYKTETSKLVDKMWIKVSCLWGSPNQRVAFCADDSFKTLWDYNINISSFAVFACYCQLLFSILWKHPQFIHTFYLFCHLQNSFNKNPSSAFAKPMLSKTSPTNVRGMARTWPPWGGEIVEKTDTFWDDHPTWSQLNQNEAKIPHVLKDCFQIIKKSTPKTFPKKPLSPTLHSPKTPNTSFWSFNAMKLRSGQLSKAAKSSRSSRTP